MRSPRTTPWADDTAAPRVLAEALREGRADRPSEAQIARMIENVTLALSTDGAESSATAQAAGSQGMVVLKLVGALVTAGVLVAAGISSWPRVETHDPRPASPMQLAPQRSAPPPSVAAPMAAPNDRALPQPSRKSAARPSAPNRAAVTQDRHTRADRPLQVGALQNELALLSRARRALPRTPERALALLAQHERQFAGSTFAQEREALAIEALLASGRTRQAAARASAFRQRYPGSPYQRRIDARLDLAGP